MEETVKDRIKEFISRSGISTNRFERNAGLSVGYLRQLRKEPSREKIKNILEAFPLLNEEWLLTGEGEMLKVFDSDRSDLQPNKMESNMIPFYDAETTGGNAGLVSSSLNESTLVGYINGGGWFDMKETAAIRHVGNSMVEYPDGCILVVRQVMNRNLLVPGRNYVFETDEYRVTKRLQHGSSNDTITLYSTNTETYADGRTVHEPFEVSKDEIRRIFSILGYVVNQSGEYRLIKP